MIIFINNIMVEFNTHYDDDEHYIICNDFKKAIKYPSCANHIIKIEEKYIQIKKINFNLNIIGKFEYIDFSELNNNFFYLSINSKHLKYLNLSHIIYSSDVFIDVIINTSLKYLNILNIKDLDMDYINDYVNKKLIITKSKYFIIEDFKQEYSNLKHTYIPMLETIII